MDPPGSFRIPASPGTPLYALSPERINQQRLPQSPSLPNHLEKHSHAHHRSSSDVASKVAFLNSLNHGGPSSPTRSAASSHAALQRAMLGREEAEAQLEENNSRLAEAHMRERRISERVESLMEELQTVKERQVHERQVFEKEVRRARKDAFKAGSALVKAQEELKEARSEVVGLKGEVQHERSAKELARQEAFERAYTLAGIMEEMEVLRGQVRAAETERDAFLLEQQASTLHGQEQEQDEIRPIKIKQEETPSRQMRKLREPDELDDNLRHRSRSRSPANCRRRNRFERLLPVDSPENTPLINWGGKVKSRLQMQEGEEEEAEEARSDRSLSEDADMELEYQLDDLKAQLRWERTLRERAEEENNFLQMECQFMCCPCRVAERQGTRFIHDWDYENKLRAESAERKKQTGAVTENEVVAEPYFTEERASQDLEAVSVGEQAISQDATLIAPKIEEVFEPAIETFHFNVPPPRPAKRSLSDQDLLRLSPPKEPSARPASALGIITLGSPIRVVPRSPLYPSTTSVENLPRNHSAASGRYTSTPKSAKSLRTRSPSASPHPITAGFKTPSRPHSRAAQTTFTTTTMVPLRGMEEDDVFSPEKQPNMPGTPITKEAALAQIRARRDRARSGTRCVDQKARSASCKSTPGSARRGLGVGVRDISAPGRF